MRLFPLLVILVLLVPSGTAFARASGPAITVGQSDILSVTQYDPQQEPDEEEDDGGLLSALTDAIIGAFNSMFSVPFQDLANWMSDTLVYFFVSYPDVTQKDVTSVHGNVFAVAVLVSTAFLVWLGILAMTGGVSGVRPAVHLLIVLAVSAVSPWLLNLPIGLSRAITEALAPPNPELWNVLQFSSGLILVTLLNSFLVIAIAVIFIIRDMYLMFIAAATPLLGIAYIIPQTRRHIAPLFSVFVAFLLIAPLDMIVVRLMLAFFEVKPPGIPNWLPAMAGFVLLVGIPFIVLSSGMGAVGAGLGYARGAAVPRSLKRRGGRYLEKKVPGYQTRQLGSSGREPRQNRFKGGGRR